MRVLVTGARGFIGSNLVSQLSARPGFEMVAVSRDATNDDLVKAISEADFICHLAGVNRPENDSEFRTGNTELTGKLIELVQKSGRKIPIVFASSVHAEVRPDANPKLAAYGASKRAAEELLLAASQASGVPVYIFRLAHVVGKWCKPNYNSVVATFCHNVARDIPISIADPDYPLRIVYIDDLVDAFARVMTGELKCGPQCEVEPAYPTTVGELAGMLRQFKASRESGVTEAVGTGLPRALWATYISYLPPDEFAYDLKMHADPRGVFVEMLKTKDSGQFSYFTAPPGVTRGGHYHHSKTEKFLVMKGKARFRFRHILTGETHELITSGESARVVETIPGWSHDITNVGDDEMIVMLWANEIFDPSRPDTYASPL